MRRRIAQGLVVLGGCALFLSGCQKQEGDGKLEISFIHWGGDETFEKCYQERVRKFEEENPDIRVKVITNAKDYDTKVQTMFVGGNAPDVLQIQASSCASFSGMGVLEDLTERAGEPGMDLEGNFGSQMESYTYGGKIYGLPDRGGTTITYYNKDLFDAAGVPYPDDDWTMEDYYSACEKLTKDTDGDGTVDQWGAASTDYIGTCGPLIGGYGAQIVTDREITVNSPEMKAFMTDYNDCYQNGWIIPYEVLESSGSNGDNFFAQGRCAMIMTGFWNVATYTAVDGLNFDLAPTPLGKVDSAWSMGSALAINENISDVKKDAAWRFIKFMTGEEGQAILAGNMGDCPANLKILGSDTFLNQEVNGKKLSLEAIGVAQSRILVDGISKGTFSSELTGAVQDRIKEMLLGRETVDEALSKMEENLKKLMKYYD